MPLEIAEYLPAHVKRLIQSRSFPWWRLSTTVRVHYRTSLEIELRKRRHLTQSTLNKSPEIFEI